MSTRRTLRHTWLLIAALAAFACSDTTAPGAGRVASVEIITEQRAFIEGDTLTLSARTLTGDGTPVSDRGPTWSSSNTSVATIAANGRVQALREGRATIRASVDGKADTIEIVVVARAIGAIEFVTPERSLVEGSATTFAARVLDLEGDPMAGRTITWTSGDTTILTATPAGLVTAVRPGKAMLRATVDGNYHAEEITVTPGEVATVDISPAGLQLVEHETRMLTASPRDAAGRLLLDRAVSWSSGNAAIATIAADGRVTARAAGSTHVFAVVADRKDSVLVTVGLAPVGSITVSPTALVAGIGESLQLSAVVRDTAGNVLSGRTILWQTDSPLIATVDQNGVVSGVGPGYATIIASTGGKTFGTAITVTNGEMDLMNHDLLYHRTTPQALGEIMVLPTAAATGPQLLNAGNVSRQPTASPDGRRIAFYVSQVDLTTGARIDDIFAVDRNGMNMKQLTSEPGYDGEPAWSPDGARIAYRHIDHATGRSAIWVMNADGAGKRKLTGDMEQTHSVGNPAWSPDGSRIAFDAITSNQSPANTGIWSMGADGSDRRQHTSTSKGFDRSPTWAPSGVEIAFIRAYGDDTDITIVTTPYGVVTRVPLPGRQEGTAWSPDGRHIAFWQQLGGGRTGIYSVRADGSNVRLHTTHPDWGGGYDPQWIQR